MPADNSDIQPRHAPFTTRGVVQVVTVLWLLALLVTLVVPSLHEGDRDWWPWACLIGHALGVLGLLYLRRGKGNASFGQD